MSPDAARALVGTTARFSGRTATFGETSCSGPSYTRRWLAPPTFADAYQVEASALSLGGSQIEFVDVTCENGSLQQGSTLIVRGDGTMLTVWDGAFYTLTRQ